MVMEVISRGIKKEKKTTECQTCGKSFKNLNQHIFKSHTKLYLTFERVDGRYLLTAKLNDQILFDKAESGVENDECKTFDLVDEKSGWYIELYNDKTVKVYSTTVHPRTGNESTQSAFKNWEVKFVGRKLRSKQ